MAEEGGPDYAVDVDVALAEAIGEPGQRRFRIIAGSHGDTTIMWLEKQQLEALGRAIEQVLDQLEASSAPDASGSVDTGVDLTTRNQFRVGRIEIGFDHQRDRLLIIAYDIESDEEAAPALAALIPRDLARKLSDEAATVVAAGRPRCVLCGLPMGPGPHACAQQNGHLVNYG